MAKHHTPDPPSTTASWLAAACGDTEMGRLVAGFDWAATPLGPPEGWSTTLRSAVTTCMMTRFPMLVAWGPDLTMVYNDGYRAMLVSTKHPHALGAPLQEVWAEIWSDIEAFCRSVLEDGESVWNEHQQLLTDRNGFLEEADFTYSYSPLIDDDGTVAGLLDIVTETTGQVLATRRLEALASLGTALAGSDHVTDVCVRAANAVRDRREDLRSLDVYLLVGDAPVLVASNRRRDFAPPAPGLLDEVRRTGSMVTVGAGGPDGRLPVEQVALPIAGAANAVEGVLVVATNPHLSFDAAYRAFVEIVGATIGTALENAYRHAVEVGEHRRISDTLQQAMLQPASDLPTVAARYLPAAGNLAVGGDWYDVIELGGNRRAIVVGDCVGHGLDAATAMGQLRSVARAMLLDGRDPAGTLEGLDTFSASVPGAYCATAVCAVIDRNTWRITYARAGHPPPLVLRGPHDVGWLDEDGGVPLAAVPNIRRINAERQLAVEDTLVFYSDGLIERRGEALDASMARLAQAAQPLHGQTVQAIADGLLRELLPAEHRDDVVVVVKHLPTSEPAPLAGRRPH